MILLPAFVLSAILLRHVATDFGFWETEAPNYNLKYGGSILLSIATVLYDCLLSGLPQNTGEWGLQLFINYR